MKKRSLALIALGIIAMYSCKDSNVLNQDKTTKTQLERKYDKAQDYTFTNWVLKDSDSVKKIFRKTFSPKELQTIVALNRVDKSNFHTIDTLVIPDKFDDDFLSYSPFPYSIEEAKDIKKLALFSYAIQAYGLYEYGELVKWGPSSMGSQKNITPEGLYFTNWKGEETVSTSDDEWVLRWNFNLDNEKGIAWHQYALPGYPASHSCLRLLEEDAKWMFDWADEWILQDEQNIKAKGTPVIVFGNYDFGGQKPWLKLAKNNHANDFSKEDINNVIKPYKAEILKEQQNRQQVAEK